MNAFDTPERCDTCPGRLACHCLGVTEEAVLEAASLSGAATINDLRRLTGAGDGCTACHQRLRLLLVRAQSSSSPSPICSVR
jgi:bacterioferritin-associated ferredoxin